MPDTASVLIVDDDAEVRDMIAEYLAGHGYAIAIGGVTTAAIARSSADGA
jgi:CheY-like chemotaxis protein